MRHRNTDTGLIDPCLSKEWTFDLRNCYMWHVANSKRSRRQSELSRIQLDISSYATLTPHSCINSTASITTLIIPSRPQCAGQFVLEASQVIPAGTSWWRRCGIISFPWRQSRQICWHVRECRRRYTKYSQTDPSSLLSDIYIYVVWDRSKLAVKNPMIDCVIVCLHLGNGQQLLNLYALYAYVVALFWYR